MFVPLCVFVPVCVYVSVSVSVSVIRQGNMPRVLMVSLGVCFYVCVCMCVCVCDTPVRHAVCVDDHSLCLCLYVYVYVYICAYDTPEQHASRADGELVCLFCLVYLCVLHARATCRECLWSTWARTRQQTPFPTTSTASKNSKTSRI